MSGPAALFEFTLFKSCRVDRSCCASEDLAALAAFVLRAHKVKGPVTLTLDLTSPARIRALNRRFRGVDRATDVISFRSQSPLPAEAGWEGDIAINVRQALLQAREVGHPARRELRLLWIHGILHLLGYTDYERIPRRRMFQRQNELLRRWERRS